VQMQRNFGTISRAHLGCTGGDGQMPHPWALQSMLVLLVPSTHRQPQGAEAAPRVAPKKTRPLGVPNGTASRNAVMSKSGPVGRNGCPKGRVKRNDYNVFIV
jgi:hypothetical protein